MFVRCPKCGGTTDAQGVRPHEVDSVQCFDCGEWVKIR